MRRTRLRVKEVAESQGLTMTKLSHRTEIAYSIIKDIFRNPFRSVTTNTLDRIADVLKVPITDLLESVDVEDENEPPS